MRQCGAWVTEAEYVRLPEFTSAGRMKRMCMSSVAKPSPGPSIEYTAAPMLNSAAHARRPP